jgi:pimeloyl-ACP methyl ester carboxylesterase
MSQSLSTAEATRTVQNGRVDLSTQAFGRPKDPAALLIMGATASMLWWPIAFCELLAAEGFFVIRYDNRDTGRSTTGAPGEPDYAMDDMADDALAILDAYRLERAHLVGMSLGGMIAQLVALKAPDRVLTLTAVSSGAFDETDPDLPPMDPAFTAHFAKLEQLDWSDRQAVIAYQVESARLSANDPRFDPEEATALAAAEFDRARDPRSAMNHGQLKGGEAWAGRLSEIRAPALILHGAHDPILSIEGARKFAATLPTSRFVALPGGHELHRADWPRIVAEIAALATRPS